MLVGTAGHVDHGKTALVKALTGIDTDRLPEEKRRGITLELGFAHLALPSGRQVGVVDVPGHERFVKAMAAGAGGIDVALLVVAADEGVMPQTREHVDICQLLGVKAGLVVVTKADLLPGLEEGWLDLLLADVQALTADTVFEDAKVLQVSAKTGAGLEALKAAIDEQVGSLAERPSDGPLFLPVDRAFTVKGFGCVVTGTLLSGRVSAGDEVSLLPGGPGPLRLRGVQVHGEAVTQAAAGQRVALNPTGLETADVHRGMVVTRHGELPEVSVVDVELSLLPAAERPLARRSRFLVTLGTAQVEAIVRLLDVEALRPGETCFAQLRFTAKVAALPGQRFILRGSAALSGRGATVGGGRVLTLNPPRRRRGAAERLGGLAAGTLPERLAFHLSEGGYGGRTEAQLFARASAPPKDVTRALEQLSAKGQALLVDKDARRFLSTRVFEGLSARALAALEAFHVSRPEAAGMSREELRQRLEVPHEKTFLRLLTSLADAKRVEVVGEAVRLMGRGRTLDPKAAALKDALTRSLVKAGLGPPTVADLAHAVKTPEPRVVELLQQLAAEGQAVRAGELYFDAQAVKALESKVLEELAQKGELTTQAFKELVGQSRKYTIPLAEYFDREKVTLRVGDKRVARKRGAE